MFVSEQSQRDFQDFVAAWGDDEPDVKTLFMEIVRRLSEIPHMTLDFTSHDYVGNSLRALRPDLPRPLVALIEIPDEYASPRSFAIRFYDDAIHDPLELGEWIPRGLFGEDARGFTVERNQPALADYLLDCLAGLAGRLPAKKE